MGIPPDSPMVQACWAAACNDAGAIPGTTAWLFALTGMPPTQRIAMHLEPGTEAFLDDYCRFSGEQLSEANSPVVRGNDRVAVYPEAFDDQRELVAILRHELEHALQWQRHPEVYKSSEILESGLSYAGVYPGLGATSLINALPIEADANAAGATLARDLFGPVPEKLAWGAHGAALRPLGQPNPPTLGPRTIAWAAMHLAAVERACRDRGTSAKYLADRVTSAGARHLEYLSGDAGVQRAAEAAKEAVPTENMIAAARSPAAAWTKVVSALRRGEQHGVALIAKTG